MLKQVNVFRINRPLFLRETTENSVCVCVCVCVVSEREAGLRFNRLIL